MPGFSRAFALGANASNANVLVWVLTAGLILDTVAANVVPGNASTCRSSDCPTLIHGAMRSGISAISFSGSTRTTVITGI